MRRISRQRSLCALLLVGVGLTLLAPAPATATTIPEATATFNSIGLKWKPLNTLGGSSCQVWYKEDGASTWIAAQDLVFDPRHNEAGSSYIRYPYITRQKEFRGSIVGLEPGTLYNIKLSLNGNPVFLDATTWTDGVPQTGGFSETPVLLPPYATDPLHITSGGTAGNYQVYTFDPVYGSATIDINVMDYQDQDGFTDSAPPCIEIGSTNNPVSNVIIRGLRLRGGRNGILIRPGCTNIVIEDCDITQWGAQQKIYHANGDPFTPEELGNIGFTFGGIESQWVGWFRDPNSDLEAWDAANNIERTSHVVIQRNRIYHPRFDSSYWDEIIWSQFPENTADGHAVGPMGIKLGDTAGNIVVRYNEVLCYEGPTDDDDRYFMDGIGGDENYSYTGPFTQDCDVYANKVVGCWDDGIEAEGGNCNVRIWGNWVDRCMVMFGNAPVSVGPLYLYRNVVNAWPYGAKFVKMEQKDPNSSNPYHAALAFLGDGQFYVYHNTLLQPDGSDLGIHRSGGDGSAVYNVVSRNNIFEMQEASDVAIRLPDGAGGPPPGIANDLECDFIFGVVDAYIGAEDGGSGAIYGRPTYAGLILPSDALDGDPGSISSGNFQLADGTAGVADACDLPNFNEPNSDLGAHQSGTGPLQFGVYAGLGSNPPHRDATVTATLQNGLGTGHVYAGNEDSAISEQFPNITTWGRQPILALLRPYQSPLTPSYQMLEWFDLAEVVPPGSTIETTTYGMEYAFPVAASTVMVHNMLRKWDHIYVNWNHPVKWLTWNPVQETQFNPLFGSYTDPSAPALGDRIEVNLDANVVQGWADDAASNFGFVLIEQNGNGRAMYTADAPVAADRPSLTVAYKIGEPAWLGGGTGSLMLSGPVDAGDAGDVAPTALQTALLAAHPNPFNPKTTLRFTLARTAAVRLDIYDVRGRHVIGLVNGEHDAGEYQAVWNGCNAAGKRVGSGVYLSQLQVGGERYGGKLVMLK